MKKLKVLKNEVKLQTIFSGIALVLCLFALSTGEKDAGVFALLISLFLIGVFNLIGFIIRLFIVKDGLNFIYLAGLLIFALGFIFILDQRESVQINFVGIGGVLLNAYYLWYGYFITKNWPPETIETKS